MRRLVVITVLAMIVASFAVLDACGARDLVGILSGTRAASAEGVVAGSAYVLLWFGVVLVVPIAVIAMLLDVSIRWLYRRARRRRGDRASPLVAAAAPR
jgi:hypothetical protein